MKKIKDIVINFINGFCMSLADSVPGVSGGTVAFVLGFYDKFIIALDDLFRGTKEKKKESFKYLVKIGIGWVVGLLLAISFLANIFEKHIYELSSLFIGFIIFAIPVVIMEEKESIKGHYLNIIFSLFGAVLVLLITYLNTNGSNIQNLNDFNIGIVMYVFVAAAAAISAMILPGISGSTILLIFGIYMPIISKIKEILHFDFSSLPIVVIFGIGMIFGIVFFTKLLRKTIDKKRSLTIYAVLGMMIGSIYSIMMGPTTLNNNLEMLNINSFKPLYFAIGGIIIISLELLKKLIKRN